MFAIVAIVTLFGVPTLTLATRPLDSGLIGTEEHQIAISHQQDYVSRYDESMESLYIVATSNGLNLPPEIKSLLKDKICLKDDERTPEKKLVNCKVFYKGPFTHYRFASTDYIASFTVNWMTPNSITSKVLDVRNRKAIIHISKLVPREVEARNYTYSDNIDNFGNP